MKITKLDDYTLLEHYKNAIKDSIFQVDNAYSKSGFYYEDLEDEILRRFSGSQGDDDDE